MVRPAETQQQLHHTKLGSQQGLPFLAPGPQYGALVGSSPSSRHMVALGGS